MAKQLHIDVAPDHLESLTRGSGLTAVSELIWNSLDADAKMVRIKIIDDEVSIKSVSVIDDGHGIHYDDAEYVFESLGGSVKKNKSHSPEDRILHGKEGKGRFKCFALGDRITFESTYDDHGTLMKFVVHWDRNDIKNPVISDPEASGRSQTGVTVTIENVDQSKASFLYAADTPAKLEQQFAVYHRAYSDFTVFLNSLELNFDRQIIAEEEYRFEVRVGDDTVDFRCVVIEWEGKSGRQLFYCNASGIAYLETSLGVFTSRSVSAYLLSGRIEELHRENQLDVAELEPSLVDATSEARELIRAFLRQREHESARDFIDELKQEDIYPYKDPPTNKIEEAERQVFDIVALNVKTHLPAFEKQDKSNKQLTFALLREALEKDPGSLQKVLSQVINLSQDKIDELSDLIDDTPLARMIDTFREITDRLATISDLRKIIFNKELQKKVLERKHFHRILENETWIFGDDYALGASDSKLTTVLRAHLEALGRKDFIEVVASGDNDELQKIPDIVLFKQYNRGRAGLFENLVIELKRPSLTVTPTEIEQVKDYAFRVANDARFSKERTSWKFILLATKLNERAEMQCQTQGNRPFGHLMERSSVSPVDMHVMLWVDVLDEAEARHQYIKEKLGYDISEDQEESLVVLSRKYAQYLPDDV